MHDCHSFNNRLDGRVDRSMCETEKPGMYEALAFVVSISDMSRFQLVRNQSQVSCECLPFVWDFGLVYCTGASLATVLFDLHSFVRNAALAVVCPNKDLDDAGCLAFVRGEGS
jgi:hypothetical protein